MYGTITGADTYHAARGNAAWAAASSADKTVALQRGADFVDRTFVLRFPGARTGGHTQPDEWPRTGATYYRTGEAIADTVTPIEIENASYEAALRELATPGILLPDYTPAKAIKSAVAGPVSVTFGDGSQLPIVAQIEGLLASILVPNIRPAIFVA